ncbi:hypothetical protein MHPYR_770008 [uncultured Mycobacterium sp.]|uniref:Uncharacterized protein n=1 Tax=uncultured Mycobacterium sp. TaxID=171292 RepID=A0A1Y5PPR7_9MYCO|nr:hypothetical protein MHPYR_770008 [uncultured Mycobacterium sp.]
MFMAALRPTAKGWVEPGPPPRCPQGHPLRGPHRVLVGTQQCAACSRRGEGPHRTYTCRACGATAYDPPERPDCTFTALDGRPLNKARNKPAESKTRS